MEIQCVIASHYKTITNEENHEDHVTGQNPPISKCPKNCGGFINPIPLVQDSTAIDYKNAFAIHKELTNYLYDA